MDYILNKQTLALNKGKYAVTETSQAFEASSIEIQDYGKGKTAPSI